MPTELNIGDKLVVFSMTMLIPDGEEATLSEPIPGWPFKFKLIFKPAPEPKEATWVFSPENGTMIMTFTGWQNPLGLAFAKPVKIGSFTDGRSVGIIVFHHKVGTMNRVDFQILLGGTYA